MPDDAVARPRFLPIVLVPDAYHHGTDDGPPEDTDCAAALLRLSIATCDPAYEEGPSRRRSATATSENSLLVRNVDRADRGRSCGAPSNASPCHRKPWEWDDQTHVFVCWRKQTGHTVTSG